MPYYEDQNRKPDCKSAKKLEYWGEVYNLWQVNGIIVNVTEISMEK